MNLSNFSFTVTFLLLVQFLNIAKSDDDCKDMVLKIMEGQMKNIVPCIKSLGLTNGKERSESYNCIMKCMLISAGTLTTEGSVTVLQSIVSILEMFPNQYVEKAFMEVQKCQEFAGTNMYDPNDKHCNLYGPLLKCGVQFIMNVCKD